MRAGLGLVFLGFRVSAKTEEPKNEEHNNHSADDIDDSVHDPFSYAYMRHSSHRKYFRLRGRESVRLLPAARTISMQTRDPAYPASIPDVFGPYPRLRC